MLDSGRFEVELIMSKVRLESYNWGQVYFGWKIVSNCKVPKYGNKTKVDKSRSPGDLAQRNVFSVRLVYSSLFKTVVKFNQRWLTGSLRRWLQPFRAAYAHVAIPYQQTSGKTLAGFWATNIQALRIFARILSMETENDDSLKCWEDFSDLGVNIEQPKHISSNVCDELQFQVCHKKHLYFP